MAEELSKNPMVGTQIKATPKPQPEIGVDTDDNLQNNIVQAAIHSNVDISALEGFSTVAQSREQMYQLIDTMSQDPILASYLKTIAEDAIETNDAGQIIWCESNDAQCARYVTNLLDSMNVDKNAFKWMHSLSKYGDLYLRLYRQSDYENENIFNTEEMKKRSSLNEALTRDEEAEEKRLKEQVNLVIHKPNDHYVNYVEMVDNPSELFELTRFGKTAGYVKAPVMTVNNRTDNLFTSQQLFQYRFKKSDVDVFSATDFVHACLEDNSSRTPEVVSIFLSDEDYTKNTNEYSYKVKRGQSELANVFKIWRELSLLENSALLSRITKSSIIRMISVEVGDMPKEKIALHLNSIKSLMEQKTALNTGKGMAEYTNPGPVENNIYIPTHDGKGAITASNIGGDFDPKQLTDLSYFQDKLFGALGIPKAFFGITDDGAGFNGGTSLAIQSSRYGKSIKRLQNTLVQAITDLVNLMLLDRGLTSYINKFTIRMQAPVTQEELDRRENKKNKISVIQDIMNQLSDITNPVIKLKILKSLLADSLADIEVIDLIQQQIDELEKENAPEEEKGGDVNVPVEDEHSSTEMPSFRNDFSGEDTTTDIDFDTDMNADTEVETDTGTDTEVDSGEETRLPTPDELGQDMTINN